MRSSAFSVAFFIATIRVDSSRGLGLEDRLVEPGRDVARQELLEDRAGVRLEDELVARDALGVLGRLDRQERVHRRPLDERRDEPGVDDVDLAVRRRPGSRR